MHRVFYVLLVFLYDMYLIWNTHKLSLKYLYSLLAMKVKYLKLSILKPQMALLLLLLPSAKNNV